MNNLAPELNDRMLADFLDMESSLIVTMHVQSVDQVKVPLSKGTYGKATEAKQSLPTMR